MIPLDPRTLAEATLKASTLYTLSKHHLRAINVLLREENSRTVEDGQWVIVDLHVIEPASGALGLVIKFYQYGNAFDRGEICLEKKVLGEAGRKEEIFVPESILGSDESVVGTAARTEVSFDDSPAPDRSEPENVNLDSELVEAGTGTRGETNERSLLSSSPAPESPMNFDWNTAGRTGPPPAPESPMNFDWNTAGRTGPPPPRTCSPPPSSEKGSRSPGSPSTVVLSSPHTLAIEELPVSDENLPASPAKNTGDTIADNELSPTSEEALRSSCTSPSSNVRPSKDIFGDINAAISPITSEIPEEKSARTAKTESVEYSELKRLANARLVEKRWQEAELLLKQQLDIETENLGVSDKETLQTMHRLANTYLKLGKQYDAEPLYKLCLEGRIKLLGEQHKTTLLTMYHLAVTYLNLNRFEEAEPFFKRTLEGRIKVYGENHENSLVTMHYLAVVYRALGRLTEAEILYRRCLEGRIEILGENNEATLLTMYHLAITYVDIGQLNEAEPLFRRTLEGRIKVNGETHENTIVTMRHLAVTLTDLGKMDEAEEYFKRVVACRKGAAEQTEESNFV
ncbi:hypothetical protein RUND412_001478 [Rhizina undulata]